MADPFIYMTAPIQTTTTNETIVASSKDVMYLDHILKTLTGLQGSFEDANVEKFQLYVEYLKHAILSKDVRDKIQNEIVEYYKPLREPTSTQKFYAGFIIIREVFAYINERFELETEDVMADIGQLKLGDE